jgi:hypothetical protein
VAVTRLALAPDYLFAFDSVNLALALEHFDPRLHQPQPPGYPLFVVQARLLQNLLGNVEDAFLACRMLAAVLAPLLLFLLGRRMYSPWAGWMAAFLLAVNPVFWRTTLTSAVRCYLAVVSVAVAYLAWRAIRGEDRFLLWTSLALGVGSGWRPSLLILLLPLWAFCCWRATRSWRQRSLAAAVLVLSAAAWFVPLTLAVEGPANLAALLSGYLEGEAQVTSPVYGSGFWSWWKSFAHGFVWHALAMIGWCWTILLVPIKRPVSSEWPDTSLTTDRRVFFLVWLAPLLAFLLLIHVASPGHTGSAIPALCLAGGGFLDKGAQRVALFLPRFHPPRLAFLAVALGINIAFFAHPFRIPHERPQVTGTVPQLVEQARFWGAYALYRASYVRIQAEELLTRERFALLRSLGTSGDVTVIWEDDDLSWRKLTYYFPTHATWVLQGYAAPHKTGELPARLWLGNEMVASLPGDAVRPLVLPAQGRVAWLLHRHSPFPEQLASQSVPLRRFGSLYLTDLTETPAQFTAGKLHFRRSLAPANRSL